MAKPRLGDIPLTYATGVRLDERDRQLLEKVAEERQMQASVVIREVLREYLHHLYQQEPPTCATSLEIQKKIR